ncbi:apoptotic chromatin condensation inducer 1b isoform X2 [Stigmatopora argus]
MADEDITLDGQPLQSLRVADLKAALEQRNLSKSGAKNKLIQRLKGALMLENLQKTSTTHGGLQPNSQIGEEMSQNSFIQQYLAKQQELLSHRPERDAQLEEEADESSTMQEEEEEQSDNDSSSCVSDKNPPATATSDRSEGATPGARAQRATFPQGHKEVPAPSPPRAVASLSVRVLGQPDRQGLPPALSRAQEKEGVAPSESGSSHSVLHLSRSAGGRAREDSDEDEDDDNDSGDDEDWGPGPGPGAARKGNRAPPQVPARSKRKLQAPQHIPQPHQNLMQLRHPTPPPSPPPDLFPLPETPKQSPPDPDDKEGESSGAPRPAQGRDSDSRSRSSSPEPPPKRRAGPLSLLVHKMESEEARTSESPEIRKKENPVGDGKEREAKARDEEKPAEKKQTADAPDSGSSSSDSDSSSKSSSSSSVRVQSRRSARKLKRAELGRDADHETKGMGTDNGHLLKREVSEPSEASVSEVDPQSESAEARQPDAVPADGDGRLEESTTPKAFAARKISLSGNKTPAVSGGDVDGGAGDADTGAAAGRKRRWGSSTAVTAKKPSISITTDSLKSLIPDIKAAQEAVLDLHPEELQLSGDEDNGHGDDGLKIRRTVTQVVPAAAAQENGETDEKEETAAVTVEPETPPPAPVEETKQSPPEKTPEPDAKKASPDDTLVRRSISQQRSGVSITIDDPIRSTRKPSPPRGKPSNIVHVTNLVRPFTLGQLKELLKQTGNLVEEGFWIDKIKSHCFVTYATQDEAAATREALHGVKWPHSNPKVLSVDFSQQDELDFHKGVLKPNREEPPAPQTAPPMPPQVRLPPLMPERDKDRERDRDRERERDRERDRGAPGVRDLWAERQWQMERREQAREEREWDRDKIREFARPGTEKRERRSRSRDKERRRRDRPKSKEREKERKTEKKEKADEPPAKLLDDLFLKTKAAPCIYWLPLTEEQAAQRVLERSERQKERERRLKEQQDEQEKMREQRKKERLKSREKGGEPDRDKEAPRNKDGEHRPGRPPLGWRSRSGSDTRDRRR